MVSYLFRLYFKPTSPILIGGIREGTVTYFLDEGGQKVIPFSSWKGAFKRVTELVAKSCNDPIIKSHLNDDHEDPPTRAEAEKIAKICGEQCSGDKLKDIKCRGYDCGYLFSSGRVYKREDVVDTVSKFLAYIQCPIEGIYGSKSFAGKVVFSDSVISSSELLQLTRTTIDRETWTVKEGHLYTEELLLPEKIEVKVLLRNPSEKEMKLWKETLDFIEKLGLQIGNGKSKGQGLLNLDAEESTFRKVEGTKISEEENIKKL
ncbi:RAMP superfamily CRISPR-associated protein [Acidianus sp. HS-5]|uniref:RAMP superfamily CRISPR-associated protein n=1 Tax=Acidianus sp. HS-5 TaxID=2886040 RepID=UPI001F199EB3|nr:RAMP superfamily CRISPR-associated protein [Acidianus sp. HS-5]BDC17514.1 hypothetical protein HS5_04040 [Acidianus sp. HS-5]